MNWEGYPRKHVVPLLWHLRVALCELRADLVGCAGLGAPPDAVRLRVVGRAREAQAPRARYGDELVDRRRIHLDVVVRQEDVVVMADHLLDVALLNEPAEIRPLEPRAMHEAARLRRAESRELRDL